MPFSILIKIKHILSILYEKYASPKLKVTEIKKIEADT